MNHIRNLDLASRVVIVRTGFRLVILFFLASFWPGTAFAKVFLVFLVLTAFASVATAVLSRETVSLNAPSLNSWDEAAIYLLLCHIARLSV